MGTTRICYCFGYSEDHIVNDVIKNKGVSSILERIVNEKKTGGCNCGKNHPLGRWCLPDVRRVVDKAKRDVLDSGRKD